MTKLIQAGSPERNQLLIEQAERRAKRLEAIQYPAVVLAGTSYSGDTSNAKAHIVRNQTELGMVCFGILRERFALRSKPTDEPTIEAYFERETGLPYDRVFGENPLKTREGRYFRSQKEQLTESFRRARKHGRLYRSTEAYLTANIQDIMSYHFLVEDYGQSSVPVIPIQNSAFVFE